MGPNTREGCQKVAHRRLFDSLRCEVLELIVTSVLLRECGIFATVMACGFLGVKAGWFSRETQKALSGIMVYTCIPAVVLKVVLETGRSAILGQWKLLLTAFALAAGLLLLGTLSGRICRLTGTKLEAYKALFMFGNTGYMGFPLVEAVLGTARMLPVIIFSISDNLLVWTAGNYFITGGRYGGSFQLKKICNPIVLSIVFSLLLAFADVRPDGLFLFDALFGLAGITRYLCMLWLGMELTKLSIVKTFKMPCLYVYAGIKMILLPLAVHALLVGLAYLDDTSAFVVTLELSLPCMATLGVLAQDTAQQEFAASMILGSMLLSALTIPLVFLLL